MSLSLQNIWEGLTLQTWGQTSVTKAGPYGPEKIIEIYCPKHWSEREAQETFSDIYIYKDNQQSGPYKIQDIRNWLSSGKVQATDLVWYKGSPGWLPLSSVPGISNETTRQSIQYDTVSKKRNYMKRIIIGSVLIFMYIVGVISSITNPKPKDVEGAVVSFFAIFIPGVLLIYFGNRARKRELVKASEQLAKIVLQLAKQHNGKLTEADVVVNTSLSIEEARNALLYLQSKDIAEIEVSESGTFVYCFRGMSLMEKRQSVQ